MPFAVARGVAVARRERPAALLSSFPPTASHVAALAVHRVTRVPWIADFRDPWTWGARHGYVWANDRRSHRAHRGGRCCEPRPCSRRSGPSLGAEVAERAAREVVVLPHGIPAERPVGRDARRARSSGSSSCTPAPSTRASADVTPVVRALLRLHEQGVPARLTLVRAGRVTGRPSSSAREALGLVRGDRPNVSREDAQRITAAADVALLVQKRPSKIWVTTKLWDYLASRTPILVVAEPRVRRGEDRARDAQRLDGPVRRGRRRRRAARRPTSGAARGDELWAPDEEALARYDAKAISRRFVELLRAQR